MLKRIAPVIAGSALIAVALTEGEVYLDAFTQER